VVRTRAPRGRPSVRTARCKAEVQELVATTWRAPMTLPSSCSKRSVSWPRPSKPDSKTWRRLARADSTSITGRKRGIIGSRVLIDQNEALAAPDTHDAAVTAAMGIIPPAHFELVGTAFAGQVGFCAPPSPLAPWIPHLPVIRRILWVLFDRAVRVKLPHSNASSYTTRRRLATNGQ